MECSDCKGTGKVWSEKVGMYILCFHHGQWKVK